MSDNVMVLTRDAEARRREIEVHIEAHRDAAAGSLLEVGRWLNAAKDEGVVPHGQWTAWVAEHAALSERVAQQWMQAARELPEGSSIAALGAAKMRSLLTLPAGEREAFAESIDAAHRTSREVDALVKAARAERDEALRLVREQKLQIREMAKAKDEAIMDAVNRTRQESSDEIRRLNSCLESADIGQKRTNKLYGDALERSEALRQEVEQLRRDLDIAHRKSDATNPEQQEQIEQLRAQIRKRDEELDRLSDELDAAQTAAMRGGMTGDVKTSPVTLILSAIGALMTQAGQSPAELMRMQGVDEETRLLLAGQARIVGQWAMQLLAACGEVDTHV